jgi:quinol monooxygenase YgiN
MIKVIVKCCVQSGKSAEFVVLARQLAASALTEPGCLSYQIAQDIRDENSVILDEDWENSQTVANHLCKPYYKAITDKMVNLHSSDPDIHQYNVV